VRDRGDDDRGRGRAADDSAAAAAGARARGNHTSDPGGDRRRGPAQRVRPDPGAGERHLCRVEPRAVAEGHEEGAQERGSAFPRVRPRDIRRDGHGDQG